MQQIPWRLKVTFFFRSEGLLPHPEEPLSSLYAVLDNQIYNFATQFVKIRFIIIIIT